MHDRVSTASQPSEQQLSNSSLLPSECNLRVNSTCTEASNWPAYYPEQRFTRPVLFLLNPRGGSGRALELFKNVINPALYEAGIEYSLFITGAHAISR